MSSQASVSNSAAQAAVLPVPAIGLASAPAPATGNLNHDAAAAPGNPASAPAPAPGNLNRDAAAVPGNDASASDPDDDFDAAAAAAPAPAVDSNCPGLQMPRDDEGVREVDVASLNPDHLWHLFCNPSVNGGYLGKSVIQFLVSKHAEFEASYPGGKFSKSALNVETQKSCFVSFCDVHEHLQSVRDFVIQKIQNLPSLRSKMRCVNVPVRLANAAAAADAAAVAAAAEPPKAIMSDNLYCRVVLFIKYSQGCAPLSSLFNRYFGNEQSRSRHASDTGGFRF
jgi:hypothetical protein